MSPFPSFLDSRHSGRKPRPDNMMHIVSPVLISTDDMVAVIFTKSLHRDKLGKHREYMLNLDRNGNTSGALSANARRMLKQLRLSLKADRQP